MGLLDSLLGFVGLGSGDSQGSSGSGSFITSWLNNAVNAGFDSLGLSQHGRDQYFNRELQREFLESEQNFQREMFGRQTDFTRDMYNLQWSDMLSKYPQLSKMLNDQQFNLWKDQFNMQNAWNAPGNQMALLKAAGINPAASGQQSSATSSMGASAAHIPPQISPTPFNANASPIGIPQGMSGRGDSIAEIGSFLRDVAEAKKKGVETDQLEKLFDYEVEERAQRIFGQRLTNDSIALANYVANNTKDIKVRRATQELVKLVSDTENVDADTALKFEQMWTERSEQLLNLAKSRVSDKEYEVLKFKVDNLQEEFKTTMANIRADTAKKDSERKLNNALRETENQLREGKVTCQELGNNLSQIGVDLAYNDLWVSNRTLDAKVTGLMHSLEREGIITKQEGEKLYQMSVSSEWAERQQFINYVSATAQAAGSVLSGAGSAIGGAASWKNAQWNNLNYQQRNQISRDIGEERNRILDQMQSKMPDRNGSVAPIVGFGR